MRLDDAEMNALKNGKKAAAKMESRIKELEAELDSEQRRMGDAVKNLRKSERKIKEMEFQGGQRHSMLFSCADDSTVGTNLLLSSAKKVQRKIKQFIQTW